MELFKCCNDRTGYCSCKEWREKQVQKIIDNVFDRFQNESGRASVTFEELYISVLLVYNDINKHLPGHHFVPPKRKQIKSLMQEADINFDGELDREEFAESINHITKNIIVTVGQGLIITLAVAPAVALLTKRTTENVPGVGKGVQKVPNAVYASLVTLVIVMFQQGGVKKA
ncbi:uncharacterized protein LOC142531141 isoform X1 [Primulina tabacum]|uniref:uncharacterized protein LOC142531141 isoform X1 n=1 Tax=Primulina tabacum TaxID=48773 RepID=UPI003F5A89FF